MSVKIRVSIPVTVRSQDPKLNPKRTNLYHIVILCVSQPRNVRRLPGPPVYTFFSGDGKPPWLGGPKAHSPHDMFIDAGFESHGNRTSPHHPVGGHDNDDFAVSTWAGLCVKASVCTSDCV